METPSIDAMRAFAEAGPAFADVARVGPIDWPAWRVAADRLAQDLGDSADCDRRIHHLYLPVLFFCLAQLDRVPSRPLMVGVQAPQGAGKTTLVAHLIRALETLHRRAAGVSIDDFYLTRAEQLRTAATHPGNPYLEHRGYPGTHDIALGDATLSALEALGRMSAGRVVRIPVYDKSAHGGRGDRAPDAAWREVVGPLDVVFVEGWMLGFTPVPTDRLPDPQLAPANQALSDYARWHRHLDLFIVLRAVDPSFVLRWRVEAEETMKASGRPGLSRDAIEDYVRRFLPAYAVYGARPVPVPDDRQLVIAIDAERRAVSPAS
jgi:D-glycerate 3-kinase